MDLKPLMDELKVLNKSAWVEINRILAILNFKDYSGAFIDEFIYRYVWTLCRNKAVDDHNDENSYTWSVKELDPGTFFARIGHIDVNDNDRAIALCMTDSKGSALLYTYLKWISK